MTLNMSSSIYFDHKGFQKQIKALGNANNTN